ncbi:unnamed protein product [Diatraea saccharalis]|uniref:unspecific monooxygenase n=1 Tax=Diatraea saccharalis TaxID=40085 RepID=A0A9N9WD49_9NEOP|nr:unnamed protein product [Diatraea saccharalis]
MLTEILLFILTAIIGYYWYIYKKIHNRYKDRDVKFLPGVPVFGNALQYTLLKRHMVYDFDEVYKAFPQERYVGYIEGTTPAILIRDPELIKRITVKDFEHFMNHKDFFTEEMDPLFGLTLIMMKDEKWRDMRTKLSPAFTGSKMKTMVPFIQEVGVNIVEYLKEHDGKDVNLDDVMRRFTTDVIATTAFGLQVNSFKDKDNEFYRSGQSLFDFSLAQRIYMFFCDNFPTAAKFARMFYKPTRTTQFFTEIVKSTMEYREKNNVVRPDMIHLLMQLKKGTLDTNPASEDKDVGYAAVEEEVKSPGSVREWTLPELVGQVFTFFVAGFETSASTITMCLHELCLNPEVQEKLYQEVKEFKETRGKLTYENVTELKYLDSVLNETFRKWSIVIAMDRICTKEYELPPAHEGGKPYKLYPGDLVYSSVNAIHMDPQYYPNPEVFNPDRFSEENKRNIQPFTFMPFGMGPRACIGSRFALLELKVLLFTLVSNFKILKCPKTIDPIVLAANDFNIKAKGHTWLKFEPRS